MPTLYDELNLLLLKIESIADLLACVDIEKDVKTETLVMAGIEIGKAAEELKKGIEDLYHLAK